MRAFFVVLFCVSFALLQSGKLSAKLPDYGFALDSAALHRDGKQVADSMFTRSWVFSPTVVSGIMKVRSHENRSGDFYLLLGLCLVPGLVKALRPKYFNDLWRAFVNPTLGARQLKDVIGAANSPNWVMNVFASAVLGIYVFYLASANIDLAASGFGRFQLMACTVAGTILIYFFKYAFVLSAGKLFNVRSTADQYNFNIFLLNKIAGMVLLPFLACFVFLNPFWRPPLIVLSVFVLFGLLANRYFRSWSAFAPFFQNSRFHFFMYLCAFEILPLAVLAKTVAKIL